MFEPAQAVFERAAQVIARRAAIVRALARGEIRLGGDEHAVALVPERLAQDLFRAPVGVDVGRVEEVDAGFEADVDEPRGFGDVRLAPRLEELVRAAERGRAKTERRNLEAGASKQSVFHGVLDAGRRMRMREPESDRRLSVVPDCHPHAGCNYRCEMR